MAPHLGVWPDDQANTEEPGETAKLLREIDRGIAADLRAPGEPSVWDEIASVFDEEA